MNFMIVAIAAAALIAAFALIMLTAFTVAALRAPDYHGRHRPTPLSKPPAPPIPHPPHFTSNRYT
ncbi:hypothetical protein [Actinomadura parmotrematis]|uniref:Uncharacterized protein n=1 Tax=Actinomadura parmotrematis TaxID=2864039 RepID=A0ABS7FXV9_9ACTN|nr:hypothetical protein [Actinomadura parmotrematis]MBW8485270.1 hypothetical protein [Actinomadura parmotrematis]